MIKTNFKVNKTEDKTNSSNFETKEKTQVSSDEFEEFVEKSGAMGSFMIYRSTKKDEELGIDEL